MAAAEWYAKAAAQGLVAAQYNLGVLYENGSGVAQDFKTAAAWFAQAAAQGQADAQYNLGLCYENGSGVAQDFKAAALWYAKADASGDLEARARRDACLARVAAASRRWKLCSDGGEWPRACLTCTRPALPPLVK